MVVLVKSIYHCNVCIPTPPWYPSLPSPVSRPQPRFPQVLVPRPPSLDCGYVTLPTANRYNDGFCSSQTTATFIFYITPLTLGYLENETRFLHTVGLLCFYWCMCSLNYVPMFVYTRMQVPHVMSGIVANGSLGTNQSYIPGYQTNIIPGELEDLNWIKTFPFVIIYIFLAHRPANVYTPYRVYTSVVLVYNV